MTTRELLSRPSGKFGAIFIGVIVAISLPFAASTATAKSEPELTFESAGVERQIPLPDYFEGHDEYEMDSLRTVADTPNAIYWYVKNAENRHCLIAETKIVQMLTGTCAPAEVIQDTGIHLQMTRGEFNDLNVAVFLLHDDLVGAKGSESVSFVTPNFIELDALTHPGVLESELYLLHGEEKIDLVVSSERSDRP